MDNYLLHVKRLNHYYGGSHTLWDLEIKLNQGDCLCLMGRNGVGKTTFLRCVMGLLPIRSGEIYFDNLPLHDIPAEKRATIGIGYVPQGREIFPQLTVEENLRVGLITTGRGKKIPERIFEFFPVLGHMLQRQGGDLSGGQQQQLAIGRALVLNPSLLILDEPTEGIQPNIILEIGEIIKRLNKESNMTILLVEQKLSFAKKIADNFVILDKGRSVANGEITELDSELIKNYLTV